MYLLCYQMFKLYQVYFHFIDSFFDTSKLVRPFKNTNLHDITQQV